MTSFQLIARKENKLASSQWFFVLRHISLHQKILCKQGHFLNGADEANIRLAETRPPMSMEMILLA